MTKRLYRNLVVFGSLLSLECSGFGQSYGLQTIAGTTTIKDGIQASTAFLREPYAVAQDGAGNVYIADRSDNRVRKVARDGTITTVAGTGIAGKLNDGGLAVTARLNTPFLLAIDKNNLYIGEYLSSLVRKLDLTTGILTTVAGNGRTKPVPGDGIKATQTAMDPEGIAVDSKGNLLISDGSNSRIRRVTPDGAVSTVAGYGGCGDGGDNTAATLAQICFPTGLGVDSGDNIYFIDYVNTRVRKIDGKTGIITPYLGDGYPFSDGDGYSPLGTSIYYPDAIGVDAAGNIYVSENNRVRYVAVTGGTVRTVAGNGTLGFGGDKGSALAAKMAFPAGVFPFANGDLLIADTSNFRIRKVTGGTIDTIAGVPIVDGAPALASLFNGPHGMTEDLAGNIIVADTYNNRIRKVTVSTGTVSTIAGTGTAGSREGRINSPEDVAIDSKGLVYFSDTSNDRVLLIQPDGTTKVFAGGNGTGYSGDGSFAKNAKLNSPGGLAIDKSDAVYIADTGNSRVRKVTADGLINLVAGNGNALFSGDGGNAKSAGLSVRGIAVDSDGTVFLADYNNSRVRRVDASSGNITTVAGNGTVGNAGDGGKAADAYLGTPYAVAIDGQRNLLITDPLYSVIRRMNLTAGTITTVAGTGRVDFAAESGAAILTNMDPSRLLVEKTGSILVSDSLNDRVRRLTPLVAKTLSMNSGDKGTGVAGTSLALSVRVTDSNGYTIQGQPVSFSVTSGTATLSSANALSGVGGVAGTQVVLGANPGAVTVRADSSGLGSVTFNLVVTAPVVVTPVISAVVGAPQSVPPVTTVSRNATVLVLFAGQGGATLCLNGASGPGCLTPLTPPYPTTILNMCVTVGGISAPMFAAGSSGIGLIVPAVPVGPADVVVTAACGTGNAVASAPFQVTVAAASPEFVYSSRTDAGMYVAAVDSNLQTPVGNPQLAPATQGQSISITAVGLSDTTPQEPIGDVSADMAQVVGVATVTLGGNALPPEAVTFVGLVPGAIPGRYRIDLAIPIDAPLGDQPITIQIGDAVSPAGLLTIAGAPSATSSTKQLTRESRKIEKDEIRQRPLKRQ